MSSDADTTRGWGRRAKVFLSPWQKYEIYVRLMREEVTVGAAATEAGVDRPYDREAAAGRQARRLGRACGLGVRVRLASRLVMSSLSRPGPRSTA
ncbi:hypothetical protein [Actinomyces qiguomingii]|uniref:hypothetical protein n=1 Tax=Actinomyces qiguomingii TaxID=2057800 RepID=UPI00157F7F68|nr:hypothetical protein [Actinomyces qiguomingii]